MRPAEAVPHLLDGNVLVALVVPDHTHHEAARSWFGASPAPFATCPTVQGTLLRLLVRQGTHAVDAAAALAGVSSHPRHQLWLDDLSYVDVDLSGVRGHRQVTDAYLAALARSRGGRLATFDRGLALAAQDVTDLVAA